MKNIKNYFRKYDETEMQIHLDNLDNDLQSMNQECDAKKKEETLILLRTAPELMLLPEDSAKRRQFEFENRFVLEKKRNKEDRIGKVKNRSDKKKAAIMKKRREMQTVQRRSLRSLDAARSVTSAGNKLTLEQEYAQGSMKDASQNTQRMTI